MSKKEIEAFLNELSEVRAELAENSDRKFVVRDTLKAEFDTLYKDYIVEGYTPGIEGNYGVNTAVRVVEPKTGRRQTLWLSGYEQEHFVNFVNALLESGKDYPFVCDFLRHKKTAAGSGNEYNRLSILLRASGDEVTVPAVPDDQYEDN